jgi:hypothetical protein
MAPWQVRKGTVRYASRFLGMLRDQGDRHDAAERAELVVAAITMCGMPCSYRLIIVACVALAAVLNGSHCCHSCGPGTHHGLQRRRTSGGQYVTSRTVQPRLTVPAADVVHPSTLDEHPPPPTPVYPGRLLDAIEHLHLELSKPWILSSAPPHALRAAICGLQFMSSKLPPAAASRVAAPLESMESVRRAPGAPYPPRVTV